MSNQPAHSLHESIRELLELLSDSDAQIEYEQRVPTANVPAELICMWFDDLYHPHAPAFREAFDADQSDCLAEFHEFFDARADALPTDGGVARLHTHEGWTQIMKQAALTLAKLDRPEVS